MGCRCRKSKASKSRPKARVKADIKKAKPNAARQRYLDLMRKMKERAEATDTDD